MRTMLSTVVIASSFLAAAILGEPLCGQQIGAQAAVVAPASLDAAFRIVQDAVASDNIPGAIALVAHQGKIVREEAFGVSDVENKTPMTPRTLCWIASITKPVTAAAAMKLVESGQLALDDPIEKFLPEFAEQKDREGRHHAITIRHLMSHSSGIQANPPSRPSFFFEQDWLGRKIAEIPPLIAKTTLEFPPGSKVLYSNAAPYVLASIVEQRSGKPFHALLEQTILQPAGMNDTYFIVPPSEASRVAVVYRDARGERVAFCRFDPNWKISMTMPDGGLFSHPRDIMKFLQLFLDSDTGVPRHDDTGVPRHDDGRVLSHETIRAMRTIQAPGYGLGWALEDDGLFHHFGSSGTSAWADPKTGLIGILFFQLQNPAKTDPLQSRFRAAVRAAFGQ